MKKIQKPEVTNYIGHNLKVLRQAQGLSLDDVAYNTGFSKAYLSQLENVQSKRPSIDTAFILAKVFKVSLQKFCFDKFKVK